MSPWVDYKNESRVQLTEINRNARPKAKYRDTECIAHGKKMPCRIYDPLPRPTQGVWQNVIDWDKQLVRLGPGDFAVRSPISHAHFNIHKQ